MTRLSGQTSRRIAMAKLKAIALNCTLKANAADKSSTDAMIAVLE